MNKYANVAALAAAGWSLGASAIQAQESYFAVDGFIVQQEERIPERRSSFGWRLGYGRLLTETEKSATSLELGMFGNPIKKSGGGADDQKGIMLDVVQQFDLNGLQPYVFAGVGQVREVVGPVSDSFLGIEAGLGLLYNVEDDLSFRVGFSGMSVKNDELRADHDEFVDLRFNVGLLWTPGAKAASAAPAAPAKVLDSDGDGLADSADRCPTTPAATADGCPPPAPVVQTDADGDGVYDSQDDCPGSLAGLKVDAHGCAVATESQSVVLKGVNFLPGSAVLTKDAKDVLDGAVAALSGQQDLKVEIGGYTDSQGKDEANLALSQKRANSVRTYLTSKGIAGDRLTAKGYGEASPIADNNTVEGRAENRRVELKVVR